jgi:diacylglycerol kinase family enzyme
LHVILNKSAGLDDKESAPEQLRAVFEACEQDCEIHTVAAGEDIGFLAKQAVDAGAERVVAAGGDGTLRAVAEAMADSGATMGVLPVGTLNHFARDMEIPLDLEEAARIAATGPAIAVDVSDVNGRVFINNSVIGLYPAYRDERERKEKAGWPKKLAILAAAFLTWWRYPRVAVRCKVRGAEVIRRTPYIMIANNEHRMEGWTLWQRDKMTEGRLWVYILRNRSRWTVPRILWRILTGASVAQDEFEVIRTSEITVETRRPRIGVSLDGELLTMSSPLHFRSRPRALKNVVPEESKRIAEVVCELTGGVQSAR